MPKILAVEDEPDIATLLQLVFERAGYEVVCRGDGPAGLRTLHEERPDLVLLDVGLPGMDGWTVLERIRDLADLPVLMLTGHDMESEKVRGLRGGADDYATKPFASNELLARAEALLRRAARASAPRDDRYADDLVQIDRRSRTVTVPAGPVDLTNTEFRLLNTFVQHVGAVLTPAQLLAHAWDEGRPCSVPGCRPWRWAEAQPRRRSGNQPRSKAFPSPSVRVVPRSQAGVAPQVPNGCETGAGAIRGSLTGMFTK
jgi:DNA-binding response OmpR family regulator